MDRRSICFLLMFLNLFVLFFAFKLIPKSYVIRYKYKNKEIVEKYSEGVYQFIVSSNGSKFEFYYNHKYVSSRELVQSLNEYGSGDRYCVSISVFNADSDIICSDGVDYYSYYYGKDVEDSVLKKSDNLVVYNNYEPYIWDGYGLINLATNAKYKVFDKQIFDNDLFYFYGDKLFLPDKNSRDFSSIKVFYDGNFSIMEFDYMISSDSYFMGDIDSFIYIFDNRNLVQYKIDVEKLKVSIVSDGTYGEVYDGKWNKVLLTNIKKDKPCFKSISMYNYSLYDGNLYLNYYDSKQMILISNVSVDDIIRVVNNKVYYISGDTLYCYDPLKGESKVAKYFDWNFSYRNKIFIFN